MKGGGVLVFRKIVRTDYMNDLYWELVKSFHATGLILYSLKTLENLRILMNTRIPIVRKRDQKKEITKNFKILPILCRYSQTFGKDQRIWRGRW